MIVGIPKEIKDNEYRVAITPAGIDVLVKAGHRVITERGAGTGSGIGDEEYIKAGAEIVDTAPEVFKRADMIVKVKEPLPQEYPMLRQNQILFTFLHLAPLPELISALIKSNVIAVAYETVELEDGTLPILTPMISNVKAEPDTLYIPSPCTPAGIDFCSDKEQCHCHCLRNS